MEKKLSIICFFIITLGLLLFVIRLQTPIHKSLPVSQTVTGTPKKSVQSASVSPIDHFFLISMENKGYSDIVGNKTAPYINSLIRTYSSFQQYSAVAHPSLPNYVALTGGDTFGIQSDCTNCFISAKNIVDQLEDAHKTWTAYMESMPTPCFIGSDDEYAQKHNPFIYFDDIRTNPIRCEHIVPMSDMAHDLSNVKTTANFVWISPNLCHDMHDCSVKTGDEWLSENVPMILTSQAFTKQHALLVIVWDESEGIGNIVPLIAIGKNVKKGFISETAYTHYSLLHTIETLWNLPPLTKNVSDSPVMTEFFMK